MDQQEMRERTKAFALRVIRLVASLPRNRTADVLGRQVLRSGTSIGANYREATRASSRKQFASTLSIAQREADETLYWLELIAESKLIVPEKLDDLRDECSQLLSIITATIRTTKTRP